jgi:hypothetical protein
MEGSDLVSWLHETERLCDVLRRLRASQEVTLQGGRRLFRNGEELYLDD